MTAVVPAERAAPVVVAGECDCPTTFATPGTEILDHPVALHRVGCVVGVLDGLGRLAALQEADRDAGARFCGTCGCTDAYACPGGCSWAAEDRCSSC